MNIKTRSLFYVSNSYHGSRAANAIQSLNTFLALSSQFDMKYYYCRRDKARIKGDQNIQAVYGPRGRLGTLSYVVITSIWVLYLSRKIRNGSSLFFSRNIYIAWLLSLFSQNKTVVELHSRPTKMQLRMLKQCAKKTHFHIICITDKLRQNLLNDDEPFSVVNDISVVPDAHPFDEAQLAKASQVRMAAKKYTKPKIGYFGSLNRYKGSELIFDLCRQLPSQVSIYSKDEHLVPQDLLSNYRGYLKPNEVFDKLLEYDIALLFLVKTGEDDDVSDFTSPLKLFEYLAAGLVVISSDHQVLREVVDDSHVLFVRNSIPDIEAAINDLTADPSSLSRFATSALLRGKDFGYKGRAINLLSKISDTIIDR